MPVIGRAVYTDRQTLSVLAARYNTDSMLEAVIKAAQDEDSDADATKGYFALLWKFLTDLASEIKIAVSNITSRVILSNKPFAFDRLYSLTDELAAETDKTAFASKMAELAKLSIAMFDWLVDAKVVDEDEEEQRSRQERDAVIEASTKGKTEMSFVERMAGAAGNVVMAAGRAAISLVRAAISLIYGVFIDALGKAVDVAADAITATFTWASETGKDVLVPIVQFGIFSTYALKSITDIGVLTLRTMARASADKIKLTREKIQEDPTTMYTRLLVYTENFLRDVIVNGALRTKQGGEIGIKPVEQTLGTRLIGTAGKVTSAIFVLLWLTGLSQMSLSSAITALVATMLPSIAFKIAGQYVEKKAQERTRFALIFGETPEGMLMRLSGLKKLVDWRLLPRKLRTRTENAARELEDSIRRGDDEAMNDIANGKAVSMVGDSMAAMWVASRAAARVAVGRQVSKADQDAAPSSAAAERFISERRYSNIMRNAENVAQLLNKVMTQILSMRGFEVRGEPGTQTASADVDDVQMAGAPNDGKKLVVARQLEERSSKLRLAWQNVVTQNRAVAVKLIPWSERQSNAADLPTMLLDYLGRQAASEITLPISVRIDSPEAQEMIRDLAARKTISCMMALMLYPENITELAPDTADALDQFAYAIHQNKTDGIARLLEMYNDWTEDPDELQSTTGTVGQKYFSTLVRSINSQENDPENRERALSVVTSAGVPVAEARAVVASRTITENRNRLIPATRAERMQATIGVSAVLMQFASAADPSRIDASTATAAAALMSSGAQVLWWEFGAHGFGASAATRIALMILTGAYMCYSTVKSQENAKYGFGVNWAIFPDPGSMSPTLTSSETNGDKAAVYSGLQLLAMPEFRQMVNNTDTRLADDINAYVTSNHGSTKANWETVSDLLSRAHTTVLGADYVPTTVVNQVTGASSALVSALYSVNIFRPFIWVVGRFRAKDEVAKFAVKPANSDSPIVVTREFAYYFEQFQKVSRDRLSSITNGMLTAEEKVNAGLTRSFLHKINLGTTSIMEILLKWNSAIFWTLTGVALAGLSFDVAFILYRMARRDYDYKTLHNQLLNLLFRYAHFSMTTFKMFYVIEFSGLSHDIETAKNLASAFNVGNVISWGSATLSLLSGGRGVQEILGVAGSALNSLASYQRMQLEAPPS